MSVNARIAERTATSASGFSSPRRAELTAATPEVPKKDIKKTNDVKIATSNLFIQNEPEVTVDQITQALFDEISAKDIVGLALNNNINSNIQVLGLTDNISNIREITESNRSTKIIPIKTMAAIYAEDIKGYGSTTSTSGVITINVPTTGVPKNTQIVLQIATPETKIVFGNWGSLLP